MESLKTIFLGKTQIANPIKEKKPPIKRIITETGKWNRLFHHDFETDTQWSLLIQIINKPITVDYSFNEVSVSHEKSEYLRREIQHKINGYKYQDMKKNIFQPEQFISLEMVLDKLLETELNCFYCQGPVKIWYENARDPLQWTLERIDNKFGHNANNVEISCLNCNLKRRCMHHERYLFTKQLRLNKQS
jgi:hypothetical protein